MSKNMNRAKRRHLATRFARKRYEQVCDKWNGWLLKRPCKTLPEKKFIDKLTGKECQCPVCQHKLEDAVKGRLKKAQVVLRKDPSDKRCGNSRQGYLYQKHRKIMDDIVKDGIEEAGI